MKKLELKNLKVKKMTKEEQSNVKAGRMQADSSGFNCTWQGGTSSCGDHPSEWPLSCSQG
jgi:hypothetical protein